MIQDKKFGVEISFKESESAVLCKVYLTAGKDTPRLIASKSQANYGTFTVDKCKKIALKELFEDIANFLSRDENSEFGNI